MTPVYFWQAMITPHMAGLARALADQGHDVTFCAATPVSHARAAMGWEAGELGRARILSVPDEATIAHAVDAAPADAVHLVEGIRPHGAMAAAHRLLGNRGARIWWMGEELDTRGLKGSLRASYYRWFARQRGHRAEAVLAIGERMQALMAEAGFAADAVHPFAYFLESTCVSPIAPSDKPFTIAFVGQMVARKRVDLLLAALSGMEDANWRLEAVGDGAMARQLKHEALEKLGRDRVHWHGIGGDRQLRLFDRGIKQIRAETMLLCARIDIAPIFIGQARHAIGKTGWRTGGRDEVDQQVFQSRHMPPKLPSSPIQALP